MASFKTHITFGVIIGIAASALLLIYALLDNNNSLLWVFLSVFFGSILPDLDSDDSTPLKALFLATASMFACLTLLHLFQKGTTDIKHLIGLPVIAFFVFRYGIIFLFKKFTRHRGMFHSIPAMLIATIGAYSLADYFDLKEQEKVFFSFSLGSGYLGHLVLDELKSTVSFHGLIYYPKRSLGTALKFFSHSKFANFFVYSLLGILLYLNNREIELVYKVLKNVF